MPTDHFDIVAYSLEAYTKELVARVLDGWAVSHADVVGLHGGCFTASLFRNAETVDKMQGTAANVAEIPRPTRAEILQKARDAKAAKKLAEKATE